MLFRSDRKSTRLNSSHTLISYAVFCLKKKRTRTVCRTTWAERRSWRSSRLWNAAKDGVPNYVGVAHVLYVFRSCYLGMFFFLMNRPPPEIPPFPLLALSPV